MLEGAETGGFKVVGRRITNPGKFGGEREWVPYYYDLWNEGLADSEAEGVALFYLGESDWELWPDLMDEENLVLTEDENGFVRGYIGIEEEILGDIFLSLLKEIERRGRMRKADKGEGLTGEEET